ncbi:hypothetical protein Nepgr_003893 [Nepenthes gracilis]|uniref:Uncharacterized protein n=1 Tax=Nepenthes gracilis TaxID=150966 RepID=A0AAD3XEB3_NEPGR|nr:hypothetical protein Nepgr_003893 [Nepenthes gracilis]
MLRKVLDKGFLWLEKGRDWHLSRIYISGRTRGLMRSYMIHPVTTFAGLILVLLYLLQERQVKAMRLPGIKVISDATCPDHFLAAAPPGSPKDIHYSDGRSGNEQGSKQMGIRDPGPQGLILFCSEMARAIRSLWQESSTGGARSKKIVAYLDEPNIIQKYSCAAEVLRRKWETYKTARSSVLFPQDAPRATVDITDQHYQFLSSGAKTPSGLALDDGNLGVDETNPKVAINQANQMHNLKEAPPWHSQSSCNQSWKVAAANPL